MLRRVVTNFGFAVALLVLVSATARAQDKVRIGLSSISATSGSIWVAEEKGLLRNMALMPRSLSLAAAPRASSAH